MSTPVSPIDPKATEAKPHPAENFAEDLQLFWLKNRNAILIGCAIVLAGIVGRGGWAVYQEQREARISSDYGAASVSTDKLKAFAAANEGHALAGAANLRVADEAYAAGKFAEAQAAYDKAGKNLKETALGARAALGSAMSLLGAGKATEAKTALSLIANSASEFKAVRGEAAYHLASLAIEEGKHEEAAKYIDQLLQVEPNSLWAQRAVLMRASLPVAAAPAAPTAPASDVKVSVPGK